MAIRWCKIGTKLAKYTILNQMVEIEGTLKWCNLCVGAEFPKEKEALVLSGKRRHGVDEFCPDRGGCKRRCASPQEWRQAICLHLPPQHQARSQLARRRICRLFQVSTFTLFLLLSCNWSLNFLVIVQERLNGNLGFGGVKF